MPDKENKAKKREAKPENGLRIRLFDADRTDRTVPFEEAIASKASTRQLLWIDIEGDLKRERRRALVDRFDLDESTDRALETPGKRPHVQLHGQHFQLRVAAEPDAEHPERAGWLDIVAGPNVVITRHSERLELLESLHERLAEDTKVGQLDSAEFAASVLDAVVTSYLAAIDAIEDDLDEFDAKALGGDHPADRLTRLVAIRRRIGRLRRLLAGHREQYGALGRRDFAGGTAPDDREAFQTVAARYESALASVESAREAMLGSFDVLMTRTTQRTNDVMRLLALVTVMAVPATVTAGFLGMNLIVPLPDDDPAAFWIVVAIVVALELGLLAVARWRRWI